MPQTVRPLMILVAGPYRSGTGDDPARMHANVEAMEAFALPLFRAGHVPIVGEWLALPLVALAGSTRVGDAAFDEIFHPIAERLLARCDGVLRVGGPAAPNTDEMRSTLACSHAAREPSWGRRANGLHVFVLAVPSHTSGHPGEPSYGHRKAVEKGAWRVRTRRRSQIFLIL